VTATYARWQSFRDAFPITRRTGYFQSAWRGPLPQQTVDRLAALFTQHSLYAAEARDAWFSEYPRIAAKLAEWHGASLAQMCFVPNATHGISMIANGIAWQPSDDVVAPANEFPSNMYPWMQLSRWGVTVTRVAPDLQGRVTAEMLLAAVTPRTRVVAASLVNFATGYRIDPAKLSAGVTERRRARLGSGGDPAPGPFCVVDAAQAAGWMDIDFARAGCDALLGMGRKFLCALDGVAWMFLSPELLASLWVTVPGPFSVKHDKDYLRHELDYRDDAWRFTGGALPTADVFALGSSMDLWNTVAPDARTAAAAIEARVMQLSAHFRARLTALGVPYAGSNWTSSETGAVTRIESVPADIAPRLEAAKLSVTLRAGGARVAIHAFNTEDEISRLAELLAGR
jgi:cysteine desulfurase/selenocysteine lyase